MKSLLEKVSNSVSSLKTAIQERAAVTVWDKVTQKLGLDEDRSVIKWLKRYEWVKQKDPLVSRDTRRMRWLIETKHPFREWIAKIGRNVNKKSRTKFWQIMWGKGYLSADKSLREEFKEKHDHYPPWLLVVDVTSRCNLKCEGCWAGEYANEPDLDYDTIERIIREARNELGITFFVLTGGEPLLRRDLFKLYEKYDDCLFFIYTNGFKIDAVMADEFARLGNIMVMISIEGNEEQTDARRGKGAYQRIINAMAELQRAGIIFGFSATATRHNALDIVSDEFIGKMVDAGCLFGWWFQYIPIGRDPNPELMVTPEHRNLMRRQVYHIRNTFPILAADFWNDGPDIGGCMAGGKYYFHITNRGDVEPCVFCHFAVDNVKSKSLVECVSSDFFKDIKNAIPYDGNAIRACMLIDRPDVFRTHWEKHRPYATHPGAETFVTELASALDRQAAGVRKWADPAWKTGDWMRLWPDPPNDYE
ncbi:MAG: radical SAM protein [Planctomycetota bacterium]|jgi:MoaA/NifB/PqqE/SkfB family radical SAM enzyme